MLFKIDNKKTCAKRSAGIFDECAACFMRIYIF